MSSLNSQQPIGQASLSATGNGKTSRMSRGKAERARSEPREADGLDGLGTSLQAELGNERGRWKDMIVQADPTPVKDGSNQVSIVTLRSGLWD